MSWKVYTGFRIQNVSLISHLESILNKLRSEIQECARQEIASKIQRRAVSMYDAYTVFGIEPHDGIEHPFTPLTKATIDALSWYTKGGILEEYDEHSILYTVFEGSVYGMEFLPSRKTKQLFFNNPMIEPYDWFDNTDKPDDVTEEDWAERERIWTSIFEKQYVPKLRMSGATLAYSHLSIPLDIDMETAMLSLEEREKACADAIASARSFKRNVEEHRKSASDMIRVHKEEYKKALEEVKGKLDPSITMETLMNPIITKTEKQ